MQNTEIRAKSKKIVGISSSIPLFFIVLVIFAISAPKFLSIMNIRNVLLHSSPLAILSLGTALVMLTNGIDLSVGSLLSLVSIVTAILLGYDLNIFLSIFSGILVGSFFGIFSGIIISKIELPSFIVTFATMAITSSLALVLCGGETVYWNKNWFDTIALNNFFGIPIPFFLVIASFIIILFLIHYTPFGVYIYGMGSNEEALRLSGVNIHLNKTLVYLMNGCCAGIAGIIIASRISSGNPIVGIGYEFEAIAAAAVGGISFVGGKGHPGFALIAAVTITMLTNGLGLMGYTTPYQYCAIGAILVVGMVFNNYFSK